MSRIAGLVVAVALALSGALLAGQGRVPGCQDACVTSLAAAPAPDRCHLSATCANGAAVVLGGLLAGALLAAPRPRAPRLVALLRRDPGRRPPRRLLVTGLDRPPRSAR